MDIWFKLGVGATVALGVLVPGCSSCGRDQDRAGGTRAIDAAPAPPDAAIAKVPVDAAPVDLLPPDAPFEGTIVVALSTLDTEVEEVAPVSVTFTVKGADARWNVALTGGTQGYRVYKGEDHAFYTVPAGGGPVQVTTEAALTPKGTAPAVNFEVVSTFAAIEGYPCERWRTSDATHRYEACVAKGLPAWPIQLIAPAFGDTLPYNAALMKKGLFPLSATRTDVSEGAAHKDAAAPLPTLARRYVVTKMTRARVDAAAFRIPDLPRVPRPMLEAPGRILR